jgi:hypothetical protein
VKAVELRASDIPVKIMCHQVKCIAISKQGRQTLYYLFAIFVIDTDIDGVDLLLLAAHSMFLLF